MPPPELLIMRASKNQSQVERALLYAAKRSRVLFVANFSASRLTTTIKRSGDFISVS